VNQKRLDFHNKVKKHLVKYKKESLNISKPGLYRYKGREYEHDHILPFDCIELNIIEKYRNDFYASMHSDIAFHKYFHHLNSSQAMCINFFYPLIKEKLLDRLTSILELKGNVNYNPNDICFEKESKVEESSTRKTNFDFYIKLDTGAELYFEIKYFEKEFGKGKKNDERRQKFRDTYWSILKEHPAIADSYKTEDSFLENYQIMRNLIHINQESYVIFIYPEENLKIKREALSALKNIIESGWENHFILLTWEDLVEKIISQSFPKELIDYYIEFESKYLNY
jgi:hypothetical protein